MFKDEKETAMKMSRYTIPLLVTTGLLLTACGSGGQGSVSGSSSGDAEITLRTVDYYNNSPDKEFYQEALDNCAAQVGVKIEREMIPGDSLISKVLQMASSKTLPDVLQLDNPDLAQIAETGALADLSTFGIEPGENVIPAVKDAGSFDGVFYGMQPIANSLALFYNEELLQSAGVEPPTNWKELEEVAAKLTDGKQYGIAFAAPSNYEGTWQFLPFMWTAGGDEKDIAGEGVVKALTLWRDLVRNGSASASVVNWTQADVNDQFMAGNAAMMVNGPWQIPLLNDSGIKWKAVPIPVPEGQTEPVAPLGGEVWTVPNTGDKQKQEKAAELVKCLNSDEVEKDLSIKRFTVPTNMSLQEGFLKESPDMEAFVEMCNGARARTGELGTKWPATATAIHNAIQEALVNGKEPSEALEGAAASLK